MRVIVSPQWSFLRHEYFFFGTTKTVTQILIVTNFCKQSVSFYYDTVAIDVGVIFGTRIVNYCVPKVIKNNGLGI